jgi:hypothetical protein
LGFVSTTETPLWEHPEVAEDSLPTFFV